MLFNVDAVLWSNAQREGDVFFSLGSLRSISQNKLSTRRPEMAVTLLLFHSVLFLSCFRFAHKQHSIRSDKRMQVCVELGTIHGCTKISISSLIREIWIKSRRLRIGWCTWVKKKSFIWQQHSYCFIENNGKNRYS